MTTYGTIPTAPPPESPNLLFVSFARQRIQTGLRRRRPWLEMIPLYDLNIPTSLSQVIRRIKTNIAYFRINYIIIILFILFLSLLWHPISLLVFFIMMVGWIFLYFVRDEPLVAFGRPVDDRVVTMVLVVVTITALLFTNVTGNVVVALSIGLGLVFVHVVLREDEDLLFVDEERVGLGDEQNVVKTPLKHAASSSFSLPC